MSRTDILRGKSVLVTGATRGLGRSIAFEYAKNGCDLLLVGRRQEDLSKLENDILNLHEGIKVNTCLCDLASVNDVISAVRGAKVDILVNCAGVFPVSSIQETTDAAYQECMMVNVTAPFLLIKELVPSMIENNWGRIINIASSSAYGGAPKTSVYCASKHALLGLSRSLHKELKEYNIRTICISPGSIKTEMGQEVVKLGQDFETFMDPQEVAEYIVYNSAFNGHMISEEVRLNRMFVQ